MPSILPFIITSWGKLKKQKWSWPGAITIFLILFTCITLLADHYSSENKLIENGEIITTEKPLNKIIGKSFSNESVLLDGNVYINCTFRNVTWIYNGGNFDLINIRKEGDFSIRTTDKNYNKFLKVLMQLGFFKDNVTSEKRPKSTIP